MEKRLRKRISKMVPLVEVGAGETGRPSQGQCGRNRPCPAGKRLVIAEAPYTSDNLTRNGLLVQVPCQRTGSRSLATNPRVTA